MKLSKSQKASLNLSINAIVVLILAISMLGLGLTFVRGLFDQAGDKIIDVTSATDLANPPTRDNVMTVTPSQLELRLKDTGKVAIAYMSTDPGTVECKLTTSATPDTSGATATVSGTGVNMKKDDINVWTAAINPVAAGKTTLFTFTMTCGSETTTRDIIVTTKN